MLLLVKTSKRRIETSGYGGRPITGVDLQPVKYGMGFIKVSLSIGLLDHSHQWKTDKGPSTNIDVFVEKIFVRLGGGLGPVRFVFEKKYRTLSMDGHCSNM